MIYSKNPQKTDFHNFKTKFPERESPIRFRNFLAPLKDLKFYPFWLKNRYKLIWRKTLKVKVLFYNTDLAQEIFTYEEFFGKLPVFNYVKYTRYGSEGFGDYSGTKVTVRI